MKTNKINPSVYILSFLLALLMIVVMLSAMTTEAYAAEGDVSTWNTSGTCEWGIDPDGCLWIRPKNGVSGTMDAWQTHPWVDYPNHTNSNIITAVVVKGEVFPPESCHEMFAKLPNCTYVDISGLNMSGVTDTSRMFAGTLGSERWSGQAGSDCDYEDPNTSYTLVTGGNTVFNKYERFNKYGVELSDRQATFPFKWYEYDVWHRMGSNDEMTLMDMNTASSVAPGVWTLERKFASAAAAITQDGEIAGIFKYEYAWQNIPYDDIDTEIAYDFSIPEGTNVYRALNATIANFQLEHGEIANINDINRSGLSWEKVELENEQTSLQGVLPRFDRFEIFIFANEDDFYTVTYDPNGGTGIYPNDLFAVDQDAVVPSNAPELSGMICTGWNTAPDGSGTHYDLGGTIPANTYTAKAEVTLYAEWKSAYYTVRYNPNGGSGALVTVSTRIDQDYVTRTQKYEKADYEQTGWNTAADGSETHYDMGGTIPANQYESGVTAVLYAEWAHIPQYTIFYHANNGTDEVHTDACRSDRSYTVYYEFSNEGYDFIGWNTAADGTGDTVNNRFQIPADSFPDGYELHLYATWAAYSDPSIMYIIGCTDTSNCFGTLVNYFYVQYSPDSEQFFWESYGGDSSESGTKTDGSYSYAIPTVDGCSIAGVYRCTNALASFWYGTDNPAWTTISSSLDRISGTVKPYGELTVYAVLYRDLSTVGHGAPGGGGGFYGGRIDDVKAMAGGGSGYVGSNPIVNQGSTSGGVAIPAVPDGSNNGYIKITPIDLN